MCQQHGVCCGAYQCLLKLIAVPTPGSAATTGSCTIVSLARQSIRTTGWQCRTAPDLAADPVTCTFRLFSCFCESMHTCKTATTSQETFKHRSLTHTPPGPSQTTNCTTPNARSLVAAASVTPTFVIVAALIYGAAFFGLGTEFLPGHAPFSLLLIWVAAVACADLAAWVSGRALLAAAGCKHSRPQNSRRQQQQPAATNQQQKQQQATTGCRHSRRQRAAGGRLLQHAEARAGMHGLAARLLRHAASMCAVHHGSTCSCMRLIPTGPQEATRSRMACSEAAVHRPLNAQQTTTTIITVHATPKTCVPPAPQVRLPRVVGMLLGGLLMMNVPDSPIASFPAEWGSQIRAAGLATIYLRCGLVLEWHVRFAQGVSRARRRSSTGAAERAHCVAEGEHAHGCARAFGMCLSASMCTPSIARASVQPTFACRCWDTWVRMCMHACMQSACVSRHER